MLISTKGRYALRVMVDLAEQDPERFVRLQEIADRQGISEKYLEGIVVKLSRAGDLVSARQGRRLSPLPRAGGVHGPFDPGENRGEARARLLPGAGARAVLPRAGLRHAPALGGAARAHRGVSWERHAPRPHGAAQAGANWGRRPRFLTLDRNRRQTIIVEETRAGRPCAVRPQHRGGQNT